MNTSRYLSSSTAGNATPVVVHTEAHATSLLGPVCVQHDSLVLMGFFSQIMSSSSIHGLKALIIKYILRTRQ